MLKKLFTPILFCILSLPSSGQTNTDTLPNLTAVKFLSLENAPTFDKRRFWASAGTGFGLYAGASVAMWHAWYKDFPLGGFQTFNDMQEWMGIDKAGHLAAATVQANYIFKGARWTGMKRRKAMWAGVAVASGLQATIEVMDGFSQEWGFSLGDMAFNTLGVGLFAAQEMLWQEQRILMKISSSPQQYSKAPIYSVDGGAQTSLYERARDLYGSHPTELFLKDYNAMTLWASFNLKSFYKNKSNSRLPEWLNLALGFGAGNIYGGFGNAWTTEAGTFVLDQGDYPRFHQFYLSPDIDFTRIPTRHRWLKFTLELLNWIKIPAPALEINTLGKARMHAIYW